MKNRFLFLTLLFAGLVGTVTTSQAYWVDEYGYEHPGVVGGTVDAADDIVGGIFGHRHYSGPSYNYCRHHPYDPAC